MKALHIGSYHINIGDNIALHNVRKAFEKQLGEINWVSENFDSINFNSEITALSFFEKFDFDFIVVGGGGLIEPYSGFSGCKIPFSDNIFDVIKCPVFFISLGINLFHGGRKIDKNTHQRLSTIVQRSSYFSLRDDGSAQQVPDVLDFPIEVLPDSGFLILDDLEDNYKDLGCVFQPAINSNTNINRNRYPNKSEEIICRHISKYNSKLLPHTPKDRLGSRFDYATNINDAAIFKFCLFDNIISSISIYKRCKSAIVMRGHGQILATAIGVPCISLSSQPKVRDYALLNGFEDYMLETSDDSLEEKLDEMYVKINSDSEYINNWYDIRNCYMEKAKIKFSKAIENCVSKL